MDNFMSSPMQLGENEDNITVISGSIENVIYYNEENGYAVCDLGTDDDDLITITGIMPYISEGDSVKVYGEWKLNARYGRQFAVSQYERFLPANATAILRYLSSGAIKGIGKKTAQKIVDEFGDDTLEVLEKHPDWLSDIPGISLKKAKSICEDFKAKAGIRSAMIFFREFFGAAITVRIYKRWGSAAIDIAKANPYRICDEIEGVGFERADKMAMKLGIEKDSASRISSGILYLLSSEAAQNGHVCMPRETLEAAASKLLEVDCDSARGAIDYLIECKKIKVYSAEGVTYLYDRRSYDNEKYIADKLCLLDKVCPAVSGGDIRLFIQNEERKCGFEYASMQKQAIALALESGVMLLTGGPGTGKTTIVKALLDIFNSMDMKVALSAPTGRAAKKLSEATSYEAKTLHRLLEFDFGSEENSGACFRRNETDLLDEHVIIVDEASMVDNSLMASLLRAVKPGARVILIGDADQLPSVGAGNVLRDLIESERFATVRLNEIFRQAEQSLIVTNAHRINRGEMPRLDVKDNDFFFLKRESDKDIALTVADLCKNRLPRTYGADIVGNIQVISPSRRGEAGTDNLNMLLQQALNPAESGKAEYKYRDTLFRVGDRVMQIKNNYDIEWCREDDVTGMGIFNGDVGKIIRIDVANSFMEIVFDNRHVTYDFTMLEELEHAYAVTVHKSQGSEYGVVIIPLYNAPPMLLTRNLFYTAVTRAQKMVILVGRAQTAERMVDNAKQSKRFTCLKYRLAEY
ncbi:MAG: ATP-dependent RecD-like DNA helicase [Ruminococcaceae bacterium]|nr:ATP-dependent RecD-like DNA helicase [Oscillospiraceae bacterium]